MNKQIVALDSDHEGIIDDCQFDFYGLRVASCDSKGFVQIVNIENEQINQQSKILFQAHKGPCWQVQWAHPKYENVIATCGYDKKIIIWKEVQSSQQTNKLNVGHQSTYWEKVYTQECSSSANCIQFCPWEYGLILLAGTLDGKVYIIQRNTDDKWQYQQFQAHNGSVTGLAWGPSIEPQLIQQDMDQESTQFILPTKRFVTGSTDTTVKLWQFDENTGNYNEKAVLGQHEDWVRDVAWSNNIGQIQETIATCSEDQKVKIFKKDQSQDKWNLHNEINLNTPVWKVSFSQIGNMLAISGGDNQVVIYKETPNAEWEKISQVNGEGNIEEQ